MAAPPLSTGTVPFSFTDIEGARLHRRLNLIYLTGTALAVLSCLALFYASLDLTAAQQTLVAVVFALTLLPTVLVDLLLIRADVCSIVTLARQSAQEGNPASAEVATSALNLPFRSFRRIMLVHVPVTAVVYLALLVAARAYTGVGLEPWQIIWLYAVGVPAGTGHAIFEYLGVLAAVRALARPVLPRAAGGVPFVRIGTREKLLFVSAFVVCVPLFLLGYSVLFRVESLLSDVGVPQDRLASLRSYVVSVVVAIAAVALMLALFMAREVARSTGELVRAMRRVEGGDLDAQLAISSTDEFADLYDGFNRMAAGLREREGLRQELQVAELIQRHFLPKELPRRPGWQLDAYYRPAREVGGDFYDVIDLPDGRLGLAIGDVSGKGVPAALMMATTRAMLRAAALGSLAPGGVLAHVNELLCPDTPRNMFVTCFYAMLDPATGGLRYANAGHDAPFVCTAGGAAELWAQGVPLGVMPGVSYEEGEIGLGPGDGAVFYTDGLVEAHGPQREMFGFPRLKELVQSDARPGSETIPRLLAALKTFTGPEWDQEDDVTLVALARAPAAGASHSGLVEQCREAT